jgi:hypothetical protein
VGVETTTDSTGDPVRDQLDWFVRAINGGPMSEEVYAERFHETFRARVPYEAQWVPIVDGLDAVPGDWLVVSYEKQDARSAVAVVAAGDERMRVSVSVEPGEPHLIDGLFVQPADLPSTPDTMENAIGRLEALGTLRMLAAEVVDGTCVPIEQVDAERPAPIASTFKLYVLGTLARAIEAGEVAWDDQIAIRDELKSIPTGILQDEPDGTVRTVEEVATLMISISDNTATDHLIDLLGRERIEAALPELGMSQSGLNVPFLTTIELAALKAGPSAGLAGQYVAADEAGKRAILEQISDITPADIPLDAFTEPLDPDTIEWFASPADLCMVLAILWDMGSRPALEQLRTILTQNPGVVAEPGLWSEVAYKGGSEPGLIAMAWLTVRPDGRVFSLAGSVLNPEETIDETEAFFVLAGARDLLAQTP